MNRYCFLIVFYVFILFNIVYPLDSNINYLAPSSSEQTLTDDWWIHLFFESFFTGMSGNQGSFEHGYPKAILNFIRDQMTFIYQKKHYFTLLDYGAGDGWLLKKINEWFPNLNLIGIDFVNSVFSVPENVHIKIIDNFSINTGYLAQSIDVIIATFSLSYTRMNEVMDELIRILKKDGTMILVIHARRSSMMSDLFQRQRRLYDRIENLKFENNPKHSLRIKELENQLTAIRKTLDRLHSNLFRDLDEVRIYFQKYGFHVEVTEYEEYWGGPVLAFGVVLTRKIEPLSHDSIIQYAA